MRRSLSLAACLCLSAGSWLAAGPASSGEPTSRYTRVGPCREVAESRPDVDPEDWVLNKCSGRPGWPVWFFFYDDAIKQRIGFGRRQNVSGLFFEPGFSDKTPLEWRGLIQRGKFEPFAVILRVSSGDPNAHRTALVVYRLQPDGTSCIIADDISTNAKAREIADVSLTGYRCKAEPDLSKTPGSGQGNRRLTPGRGVVETDLGAPQPLVQSSGLGCVQFTTINSGLKAPIFRENPKRPWTAFGNAQRDVQFSQNAHVLGSRDNRWAKTNDGRVTFGHDLRVKSGSAAQVYRYRNHPDLSRSGLEGGLAFLGMCSGGRECGDGRRHRSQNRCPSSHLDHPS